MRKRLKVIFNRYEPNITTALLFEIVKVVGISAVISWLAGRIWGIARMTALTAIPAYILMFLGAVFLVVALPRWIRRRTRVKANDKRGITLRPAVAQAYVEHGYIYQVILYVENHDNAEIADCYATLEQARYVYSIAETPIQVYDGSVRLNWTNSLLASEDCQITIPPRSTDMGVLVATFGDRPSPRFSVCRDSKAAVIESVGTFLIRIRVNGKRRGEEMEYLVFDGSIHYEHSKEPQFKAEDWTNDQRSKEIQAPE